MKHILRIILIIILMIGIYTYAHVNHYQYFIIPEAGKIMKYDKWTDTFSAIPEKWNFA